MHFIIPKLEQVNKMWNRVELIFELKSPLHIGYLPSGFSVSAPTRYYVPGRNFWGALTQRITEFLFSTPVGKDYMQIGQMIKNNFRFSYFYIYDGKNIYLPKYSEKGFYYGEIEEYDFQYRFIGSRVMTAIDNSTGKAKDKTLYESEFISEKFIDNDGTIQNTKIIGTMWIRQMDHFYGNKNIKIKEDDVYIDDFKIFEEITIGGEQNIGFGRLKLNSIYKGRKYCSFVEDFTDKQEVKIKTSSGAPIFGHVPYDERLGFLGDLELLSGRQYYKNDGKTEKKRYEKPGEYIVPPELYFAPGTILYPIEQNSIFQTDLDFVLRWDGVLYRIV